MRPSERAIRDELRREAAQVTIPAESMWENIRRELDRHLVREQRCRRLHALRTRWRPAMAFAAAAGIFWLTVVPLGVGTEGLRQPEEPPVLSLPSRGEAESAAQSSQPEEHRSPYVRMVQASEPFTTLTRY